MCAFQSMARKLQNPVGDCQQHSVAGFCEHLGMESVGARVKAEREAQGMSRKELCRLTGIGYSTLAELERGGMNTSTKLRFIADALRVSLPWLETGKGSKNRVAEPVPPYQPARPDRDTLAEAVRLVRDEFFIAGGDLEIEHLASDGMYLALAYNYLTDRKAQGIVAGNVVVDFVKYLRAKGATGHGKSDDAEARYRAGGGGTA